MAHMLSHIGLDFITIVHSPECTWLSHDEYDSIVYQTGFRRQFHSKIIKVLNPLEFD